MSGHRSGMFNGANDIELMADEQKVDEDLHLSLGKNTAREHFGNRHRSGAYVFKKGPFRFGKLEATQVGLSADTKRRDAYASESGFDVRAARPSANASPKGHERIDRSQFVPAPIVEQVCALVERVAGFVAKAFEESDEASKQLLTQSGGELCAVDEAERQQDFAMQPTASSEFFEGVIQRVDVEQAEFEQDASEVRNGKAYASFSWRSLGKDNDMFCTVASGKHDGTVELTIHHVHEQVSERRFA
jgi:hypothetical protein